MRVKKKNHIKIFKIVGFLFFFIYSVLKLKEDVFNNSSIGEFLFIILVYNLPILFIDTNIETIISPDTDKSYSRLWKFELFNLRLKVLWFNVFFGEGAFKKNWFQIGALYFLSYVVFYFYYELIVMKLFSGCDVVVPKLGFGQFIMFHFFLYLYDIYLVFVWLFNKRELNRELTLHHKPIIPEDNN